MEYDELFSLVLECTMEEQASINCNINLHYIFIVADSVIFRYTHFK